MLKRLFCNNLISEIVCKRKNSILFIKIVVADNGDLSATFFLKRGFAPLLLSLVNILLHPRGSLLLKDNQAIFPR